MFFSSLFFILYPIKASCLLQFCSSLETEWPTSRSAKVYITWTVFFHHFFNSLERTKRESFPNTFRQVRMLSPPEMKWQILTAERPRAGTHALPRALLTRMVTANAFWELIAHQRLSWSSLCSVLFNPHNNWGRLVMWLSHCRDEETEARRIKGTHQSLTQAGADTEPCCGDNSGPSLKWQYSSGDRVCGGRWQQVERWMEANGPSQDTIQVQRRTKKLCEENRLFGSPSLGIRRHSGLNCVPLKFICWGPNPQHLRIWPYLEIETVQG